MDNKGLLLLLGLFNATSATQEMDQGYGAFKRHWRASTIQLAGLKIVAQSRARKNPTPSAEAITDFLLEEENLSDKDKGSPEDADEFIVGERKQIVYNVTLVNLNLANIVNGFPRNPIELRQFGFVFQ